MTSKGAASEPRGRRGLIHPIHRGKKGRALRCTCLEANFPPSPEGSREWGFGEGPETLLGQRAGSPGGPSDFLPQGLAGRWEPGAQFGFLQAHSKGRLDFWKGSPLPDRVPRGRKVAARSTKLWGRSCFLFVFISLFHIHISHSMEKPESQAEMV